MILTQKDVDENFETFATRSVDGTNEGYTLELSGLNTVDPLIAIQMMRKISYAEKAAFVRKLIVKRPVAISLYGESVVEFTLTSEEAEFYVYDAFVKNPTALSFLISAVYSEFLKNSVPRLTDSQETARKAWLASQAKQGENSKNT